MLSIIISGGIQSDEAMTGGLGSKNQVGASAEIGFYCALMCFGVFRSYWKKFVFGLVPLLFFTLCLKLSQSATSNMSLLAMLAITLTGYILTKLPQKFRMPLFITGTVLIVVLVVVGITFNAQELVLKAAGKDATLTGRTDLWAVGIKTGMETPLVGVGTGAFWVIGHPVAEKLWYQFGIYDRMGFHFHNLFINVFVELGFVGAFLWAWLYLSTSTKIALYLVRNGANVETIFYLGMVFMYLVRSATESDTPGPYGTGPLLFFFLVFRVAMLSRQGLEKNAQPVTSVAPPSGKLLSPVSQGKL
jgi:exopolysaccharide production protein ExoQ